MVQDDGLGEVSLRDHTVPRCIPDVSRLGGKAAVPENTDPALGAAKQHNAWDPGWKTSPRAQSCAPAPFLLGLSSPACSTAPEAAAIFFESLGAGKAGLGLREVSEPSRNTPGLDLGSNCDGSWQEKLPRKGQASRTPLRNRFHRFRMSQTPHPKILQTPSSPCVMFPASTPDLMHIPDPLQVWGLLKDF